MELNLAVGLKSAAKFQLRNQRLFLPKLSNKNYNLESGFNYIALLFFIMILAFSCENETEPVRHFTEKGNYEYYHHIKNELPTAQPGDSVVFHFCLRNGETKVSCTHHRNNPVSLILPSKEANFNKPLALYEGVSRMAAGDSISLYYPIMDQKEPLRGFEGADFVIYDIKVLEIFPNGKF